MADVAKTVDSLSSLPSNSFPDEWVKHCWDQDFLDVNPLCESGGDTSRDLHSDLDGLSAVVDILSQWIEDKETPDGEGFWTVLVQNDISFKAFMALLSYIMDSAFKHNVTMRQRELAYTSASAYLKLVTIPGSGAFRIFHPVIFQKCLDLLKAVTKLNGSSKRPRAASPPRNNKQQRRNTDVTTAANDNDDMIESDGEDDVPLLSVTDVSRIQSWATTLLFDLMEMLNTYSLSQSQSSLAFTVDVLILLTKMHVNFTNDLDRSLNKNMSLSQLAYYGLLKLCSSSQGDLSSVLCMIFKGLLPSFLMYLDNNKATAQTIPRDVINTKDQALAFVVYLLDTKGSDVLGTVRILLQHMCSRSPDKTEYRTKIAQTVVTMLKKFPVAEYASFLLWVEKFSKHSKISHRVFCLDLISFLVELPQGFAIESVEEDLRRCLTHKFLIEIVLARCSDIAPTTRARAISVFSQCVDTTSSHLLTTVRSMFTPAATNQNKPQRVAPTPFNSAMEIDDETEADGNNQTADNPNDGNDVTKNVDREIDVTPGQNLSFSDNDGVISMLRRRSGDQKVHVRKAAISAIQSVIRLGQSLYNVKDLEVVKRSCRDPALSIRKQSMQSLTELLIARPLDQEIQSAWLEGVFPLIMDRETAVQEKCGENLDEIILDNIVPYSRCRDECHTMVWSLLDKVAEPYAADSRRYLQLTCQMWTRQNKIKKTVVLALQSHVNTPHNKGAWLLLSMISSSDMSTQFIVNYWNDFSAQLFDDTETLHKILIVIKRLSSKFNPEDGARITRDLKTKLFQFECPTDIITEAIFTLDKLSNKEDKWAMELVGVCDKYLTNILSSGDSNNEVEPLMRHLFTLGDVALLCPSKIPRRIFHLVLSFIAAPAMEKICSNRDSVTSHGDNLPSQIPQDDLLTTEDVPMSQVPISQEVPSSQYPVPLSQDLAPLSQFGESKMAPCIQAISFITLGKLCLQHDDLAKKCVAVMARELERSEHISIRNNIVIVLCDLCVRYTTLVDQYIPVISTCLKDPAQIVRKQTFVMISRLLQEDFLKWKGSLFYRFIMALEDDDTEIKELAEFALTHLMLTRHPGMFFQHFIECIFHFNAYQDHSVYNKFPQTDREISLFSLKGKQYKEKRMRLYCVLLENMADEHRFQLVAKLSQEVLGALVDNMLPYNPDTMVLLEDTLDILSSKEIKLSSMRTHPNAEEAVEELDMAAVVMATAKRSLITQAMKKNVIENVVPLIISLKYLLEKNYSPLIKNLMSYLQILMKDYKNEVDDILSADRQLASEIRFDMRRFEEQEQQKRKSTAPQPQNPSTPNSAAVNTPTPNTTLPANNPAPASPKNMTPPTTPQADKTTGTSSVSKSTVANSSGMKTPTARVVNRRQSLATLALVNSAKKAMDRMRRMSLAEPSRKSISPRTPTMNLVTQCSRDAQNLNKENSPLRKRQRVNDLRAISTPTSNMLNITFQATHDITMLPPSPISKRRSVRSNSSAPTDTSPPDTRDLICMKSPDAPDPKPKKWNVHVTSPLNTSNTRRSTRISLDKSQKSTEDIFTL